MGSSESSPPSPPPPTPPPKLEPRPPPRCSPEYDTAWRKTTWGDKSSLEKKLREFRVSNPDVERVRILVVGEVGAGKSSFINSVNNVFQQRITCEALVDATSGTSFTKVYKTHYIEGNDGSPLAFVFNDIMGLESSGGAHENDIIKALEGCVKEGHKFNPASPITSRDHDYKSNPSLGEQTCCLVNIIAADKISRMNNAVIEKMKRIRQSATDMEMPQVIVMTRVDEACPLVKGNIQKIYTSKKIKEKMQECSNSLGVPMNHIFPVKNYHEEIDTENDMDVLILKALQQIVNIANDALKKKTTAHKCE